VYQKGANNKGFKLWVVLFLFAEYTAFTVFLILQLTGHKMPPGGSVINVCGYCKAAITFIKYTPQVYLNYRNKSTSGWSIGNVALDFCGGLFSLLQLIIEAVGNGRPIIGDGAFNAIKFALSILSIFYNIVFFIQHYVLYPPSKRPSPSERYYLPDGVNPPTQGSASSLLRPGVDEVHKGMPNFDE
jgi:cystinosin